MSRPHIILLLVFAACAPSGDHARDSAASHVASPTQDYLLIDTTGIGPIHLGQTLGDAQRTLPAASFKRTSDGDGAVLVAVDLGRDTTIVLYADESDPDKIDWSNGSNRSRPPGASFTLPMECGSAH